MTEEDKTKQAIILLRDIIEQIGNGEFRSLEGVVALVAFTKEGEGRVTFESIGLTAQNRKRVLETAIKLSHGRTENLRP